MSALFFLRCVGKAVANAAGAGIAGDVLFEALPEVARVAWKWWGQNRTPEQRQQDLAQVAAAPAEQVRLEAKDIVLELAADRPAEEQKALEAYLTLVPGQIRQSMRRPEDPSGATVAFELVPQNEEQVMNLLPTRLPRFKPGDRPLPGVDWELVELLGVGGFGEVWKARNAFLDNVPPVALKFCLDPRAAQYLRNEAAVLNRVMRQGQHPGIVALTATYLSSETPCLAYEYVSGGDLAGLIQEWHRSANRPTCLEMTGHLRALAEVMAVAHGQNPPIVHRDLKPANVLRHVESDGRWRLRIADFGIGGLASQQAIQQHTQGQPGSMFLTAMLRGACTPLYASPQQLSGRGPDPRDDVFALGVIWYQMLIGDLTKGRPGGTRWQAKLRDAGLSPELVDLLAECLEDDPDDRIADAGSLAARLGLLLGGTSSPVTVPSLPPISTPVVAPPALKQADVPPSRPWQDTSREQQGMVLQLAELNATIERTGGSAQELSKRGDLLRRLGKLDDALVDCTEAIRRQPTLSDAYAVRGTIYRTQNKLDLALADCTRALELDARCLQAMYNRAEVHRLRGENARAVADCDTLLRYDPHYAWAYGTRGVARRSLGDLSGALLDLNECLRLDPHYSWGWAARGETYRLMHDFDAAIADCTEALRLQSTNFAALATRGAAFRQKGDFATAIEDLQQVIRQKPDYGWARDQLELARKRQR
jgi:serine/threonine protein kinase/Tfp pilus assembly protein PilF